MPNHGVLSYAIRSETTAPSIRLDGKAPGGGTISSTMIRLPELTDSWQVFHLPLANSGIPATLSGYRRVTLCRFGTEGVCGRGLLHSLLGEAAMGIQLTEDRTRILEFIGRSCLFAITNKRRQKNCWQSG